MSGLEGIIRLSALLPDSGTEVSGVWYYRKADSLTESLIAFCVVVMHGTALSLYQIEESARNGSS